MNDVQPKRPAARARLSRYAERFLFLTGIILLAIYVAALGYARFSQAYYEWSFERVLKGRPAPLVDFVKEAVLHRAPLENAGPQPPAGPDTTRLPLMSPGSLIGRMEIPGINLSVMVIEGTGRKELSEGVGHIEGTPLPGQPGNFGIAGHRDSFFRALKDISGRDIITLTTLAGRYQYRVEETRIVRPSDTSVLDSTRDPTLTLVTCYPFYYIGNAPKRFIVKARLLGPDTPQGH